MCVCECLWRVNAGKNIPSGIQMYKRVQNIVSIYVHKYCTGSPLSRSNVNYMCVIILVIFKNKQTHALAPSSSKTFHN